MFSVFQVDHENVALHMVSKQTLTSAGNDFEFPMGSKSNQTCQGPYNEHTNHVSIPSLQWFLKKDY